MWLCTTRKSRVNYEGVVETRVSCVTVCGSNGAAWSSGGRVWGSQPADAMDLSLLAREVHVEGTDLAWCGVSREHTAAAPQAALQTTLLGTYGWDTRLG